FAHLKPSAVMQEYPAIFCGGLDCFLTIPKEDFNKAWVFKSVSMGGCIHYKLKRRYLVQRIVRIVRQPEFTERSFFEIAPPNYEIIAQVGERKLPFYPEEIVMHIDGKNIAMKHVFHSMYELIASLRASLGA